MRLGRPSVNDVVKVAAEVYGVARAELVGPSKRRPITRYRHVAMAAARQVGEVSWRTLGAGFGGREMSTAAYACRKVAADPELHAQADALAAEVLRRWEAEK